MKPKHLFLPSINNDPHKAVETESLYEVKGLYRCPCCDCRTLPVPAEEALAYICPVCFWENDLFLSGDDEPSDENHGITLNEGRRNYQSFGACTRDMCRHVRKPTPEEIAK